MSSACMSSGRHCAAFEELEMFARAMHIRTYGSDDLPLKQSMEPMT